jgi:sulfate adenylyltransferase subunit 1
LLDLLETVEVQQDIDLVHARFPVQYVIRPQTDALHDYRGYAGKLISGIYRKGDEITVFHQDYKAGSKQLKLAVKKSKKHLHHKVLYCISKIISM